MFGAKPAPLAPFLLKCGGRANPCVRNLLGFRRVRRTAQEQRTCSPAFGTAQRLSGVVIVRALPLAPRVPLRYALPRPFSGRVSKGEGPQPRPFVSFQGGPGGNRNPPGFLFGGHGGTLLFSKEKCLPFPRPPEEGITDRPSKGAYSYISARPVHGSAPRWGWCGPGCPPPPESGW